MAVSPSKQPFNDFNWMNLEAIDLKNHFDDETFPMDCGGEKII